MEISSLFHLFDDAKHDLQQIQQEKESQLQTESELDVMHNELMVMQAEINGLSSKSAVLQSRIRVKEEQMRQNEQLMLHLSSQVQSEGQQMQSVDRSSHQAIHDFMVDLCADGRPQLTDMLHKMSERMDDINNMRALIIERVRAKASEWPQMRVGH